MGVGVSDSLDAFPVTSKLSSLSEQNNQAAEWERTVFIIDAQTLKRAIALRNRNERGAASHFDPTELAEAAASIGLTDPEAHAKALVQVNTDFADYTKSLEAILASDPNGLQFTVPSEEEFRAGREVVEAEDDLRTRLKATGWVQ